MFAVCRLAIPMLTEVASGRTIYRQDQRQDVLISRIQPAIFTEWRLRYYDQWPPKSCFFCATSFFTRLKWSLSPFPKFRYLSSNLPEAGPSFGQFFFFSNLRPFAFSWRLCALVFADFLHHVSNRQEVQKPQNARIISNQWFLLGTFFFFFTLPKLDLHDARSIYVSNR